MEEEDRRDRRKNRRGIIILRIILIILIVGVIATSSLDVIIYLQNKKDSEENVNLSRKLEQLNNEKEELLVVNSFNHNVDLEINEMKELYFTRLKEFEDKVASSQSKYKIAYLTFDDGPYYKTYDFLKILEEEDVLATFFTIGQGKEVCYDDNSKSCANIYQDIAKYGHTMANHTYTHAIFYGLYDSADNFMNSVIKQEELIKSKTGVITNIVRFPGGSSTARNLKDAIIKKLRERGYGYVDWTSQDGDGADIQDINEARRIFKSTINENIEVVLFHDYNSVTLKLLPEFIDYLRDNGYVLLPLFKESRMVNK